MKNMKTTNRLAIIALLIVFGILECSKASAQIMKWEDAPVTMTFGFTFNKFYGDQWPDLSQQSGGVLDLTYKYFYGAIGIVPCSSLTYIHFEHDYPPFERAWGRIHSYHYGLKLGGSLPVQVKSNMWNFTAYVAASMMHLQQHDKPPYSDRIANTDYFLIGPGAKIQCAMWERCVFGLGYEQQFFTKKDNAPDSYGSVILSIGYLF